jgi:hypothetical protein
MISTTTNSGPHDFVGRRVLAPFVRPGLRAAAFSGESICGGSHILVLEEAQ